MAKLNTLIDDFSDNIIDTGLWTPSGAASETGGRIVLTPSGTVASLSSASTYDLTNSSIVFDIPVVTNNGTTGSLQCGVVVQDSSGNFVAIYKIGSELRSAQKLSGTQSDLSFTPYNATNHRFWRIRETSGQIYWETSTNGVGWFTQSTNNTSLLAPFDPTVVQAYFYTIWSTSEASPGTFQVEAVNPSVSGAVANSAVSSLAVSGIVPVQSAIAFGASTEFSASIGLTSQLVSGGMSALAAATITISSSVLTSSPGLRDVAGNLAVGFTDVAVTNDTAISTVNGVLGLSGISAFEASGVRNVGLRDVSGNLAVGFTDVSVSNDTPIGSTNTFAASSTATLSITGFSAVFGDAAWSGSANISPGTSYESVLGYNDDVPYDGGIASSIINAITFGTTATGLMSVTGTLLAGDFPQSCTLTAGTEFSATGDVTLAASSEMSSSTEFSVVGEVFLSSGGQSSLVSTAILEIEGRVVTTSSLTLSANGEMKLMIVEGGLFRYWNGSTWSGAIVKVWDGSSWVVRAPLRWNGLVWTSA